MDIKAIGTTAMQTVSHTGLVIKKYSPEILTAVGVVSIVGGSILACKETLHVEDILDEHNHNDEMINSVHNGDIDIPEGESYTEEDYKKDVITNKLQTGVKIAKLYGPSVALGVMGIGCILGSHYILSKRNVALLSAYKLANDALTSYRERVVKQFGADIDRNLYYGVDEETVTEEKMLKNGKTKEITKKVSTPHAEHSQYARFFDECCPNWNKDPSNNKYFLECVQNLMNDTLRFRGHLFLNEVYDALGFERTPEGAVVGWIYDKSGKGSNDGYVDFDLFRGENRSERDFVNGYERSYLLDFNVDGVIYDLI